MLTEAGKAIAGLRINETNFNIQIRQQDGQFHSFNKRDLEEVTVLETSLMPDNMADLLTVRQLHDLFAIPDVKGIKEPNMSWTKPDFVEMSLCMEVTAYVNTEDELPLPVERRSAPSQRSDRRRRASQPNRSIACEFASWVPPRAAACRSGIADVRTVGRCARNPRMFVRAHSPR